MTFKEELDLIDSKLESIIHNWFDKDALESTLEMHVHGICGNAILPKYHHYYKRIMNGFYMPSVRKWSSYQNISEINLAFPIFNEDYYSASFKQMYSNPLRLNFAVFMLKEFRYLRPYLEALEANSSLSLYAEKDPSEPVVYLAL